MKVKLFGDLQTVLTGQIQDQSLHEVSLREIAFGLGAGKLNEPKEISYAETLIWENKAYLGTWKEMHEQNELKSPFLVGIFKRPKERHFFEKKTLQDIYQELLKIYPKGFVCVGEVAFYQLEGSVIKKDPIYQEPILNDDYLHKLNLLKTKGDLFGVAMPTLNPQIFYSHPYQKALLPFSHTHVKTSSYAMHLFPSSALEYGDFWAESIEY